MTFWKSKQNLFFIIVIAAFCITMFIENEHVQTMAQVTALCAIVCIRLLFWLACRLDRDEAHRK